MMSVRTYEGTILCLDVPVGTRFGIDYMSWITGERFVGVKMIPSGVHYVHITPARTRRGPATAQMLREQAQAARVGFFCALEDRGAVLVYRWNAHTESLQPLSNGNGNGNDGDEEERRYVLGVKRFDFDRGLAPYPLDKLSVWQRMSNFITVDTVARIQPLGVFVDPRCDERDITKPGHGSHNAFGYSVIPLTAARAALEKKRREREAIRVRRSASAAASVEKESDVAALNEWNDAKECRVVQQSIAVNATAQPTKVISFLSAEHASDPKTQALLARLQQNYVQAAKVTRENMDKSDSLGRLLRDNYGASPMGLLGELQFAFVTFLIGQSYEGFEHWKALVALLCTCDGSIETHPELYAGFVATLCGQLQDTPADFFIDPLAGGDANFLRTSLRSLLEIVENTRDLSASVRRRCEELRTLLATKFHWTFGADACSGGDDDNGDEYAPLVVNMPTTTQVL